MAEVEKLKLADKEAKAWGCLSQALQDTLNNVNMDLMKKAEEKKGGEEAEQEK